MVWVLAFVGAGFSVVVVSDAPHGAVLCDPSERLLLHKVASLLVGGIFLPAFLMTVRVLSQHFERAQGRSAKEALVGYDAR